MLDKREMRRFEDQAVAIAYAKRMSAQHHDVRYVIMSPGREDEAADGGPYVVDTDGFTRYWERTVAVFENGKKER